MVCIQVLSEDAAIAFAASQGNFELNAMRPVIISNFLHAATILADAATGRRLQHRLGLLPSPRGDAQAPAFDGRRRLA